MKKDERCYWCGNSATSREHVPPRCLFPAMKDIEEIYDKSFRSKLISVPSCDEHNIEKSHEDEYLMACLSGRVGNNGVAYIHNATKVRRSRERNPNLVKVVKEGIINLSGNNFPVQMIKVENYKLVHSFEAIARALYFHEKNERFNEKCTILSDIFINPSDKQWSSFNIRAIEMIEIEQQHWGTEVNGANPDIFTYQFSPIDGYKCQTLALTFYKATKIYVILCGINKSGALRGDPDQRKEIDPR